MIGLVDHRSGHVPVQHLHLVGLSESGRRQDEEQGQEEAHRLSFLVTRWNFSTRLPSVGSVRKLPWTAKVSRSRCAVSTSSGVPRQARRPRSMTARRSHSRRSEEHTSELQSLMRISYAV